MLLPPDHIWALESIPPDCMGTTSDHQNVTHSLRVHGYIKYDSIKRYILFSSISFVVCVMMWLCQRAVGLETEVDGDHMHVHSAGICGMQSIISGAAAV